MPTYGYRCTVCEHTFERVQKMTDPALTECENCGQPVKKILYAAALQFKGSGFYVTDYMGAGKEPASTVTDTSTPAPAPATTESKTATTESAPATPAAAPATPVATAPPSTTTATP